MTFNISINYVLKWFLPFALTLAYMDILAQGGTPTIFDCLGAKPICQEVFREDFLPRGEGNFTGEFDPEFSCLIDDNTAVWYTFITHRSGNLGFRLAPANSTDDFNWGLFDITDEVCRSIFSNPSMLVSCNATGGGSCNGPTGADNSTSAITQEGSCNSSAITTQWNSFVPVEADNLYALVVYDVSGLSSGGFEIDFSLGDDVLLGDNKSPEIKSINTNVGIGCIPKNIWVQFTENLMCQSISVSNFKLTDKRGRDYFIDLDSGSCNLNGEYDRRYAIALQEPLPAGESFLLEIIPNESHPMIDLCGNSFSPYSFEFETNITELAEIYLPVDTTTCETMLTLDVTDPNATEYAWSDGNTNPIAEITSGGLYFVTVSNTCERVNTSINVSFEDDSDIVFSLGRDTILCEEENFILSPDIDISNYEYEWSDGIASPNREVSQSGMYTLEVTNECGSSFSSSINVDFQNINIDLGPDTTVCIDSNLSLDVTHPNAMNYQWSTGETTPKIMISERGLYSVELSNDCMTVVEKIAIEEIDCRDCQIYVPNIISRDGLGVNSQFKIASNCRLEDYHLSIYNRWGSLLFDSTDQADAWSAAQSESTKGSASVYVYQLKYSYTKNEELIDKQMKGSILLID